MGEIVEFPSAEDMFRREVDKLHDEWIRYYDTAPPYHVARALSGDDGPETEERRLWAIELAERASQLAQAGASLALRGTIDIFGPNSGVILAYGPCGVEYVENPAS